MATYVLANSNGLATSELTSADEVSLGEVYEEACQWELPASMHAAILKAFWDDAPVSSWRPKRS